MVPAEDLLLPLHQLPATWLLPPASNCPSTWERGPGWHGCPGPSGRLERGETEGEGKRRPFGLLSPQHPLQTVPQSRQSENKAKLARETRGGCRNTKKPRCQPAAPAGSGRARWRRGAGWEGGRRTHTHTLGLARAGGSARGGRAPRPLPRLRWPPRSWRGACPCRPCAPPCRTSTRHRSAAR